jgi:hypothetical protein
MGSLALAVIGERFQPASGGWNVAGPGTTGGRARWRSQHADDRRRGERDGTAAARGCPGRAGARTQTATIAELIIRSSSAQPVNDPWRPGPGDGPASDAVLLVASAPRSRALRVIPPRLHAHSRRRDELRSSAWGCSRHTCFGAAPVVLRVRRRRQPGRFGRKRGFAASGGGCRVHRIVISPI